MTNIDLKEVGFNIQMAGMLLADKDKLYVVAFPDELLHENKELELVVTNAEEYKALIRQMDIQELVLHGDDKNRKTVLRKSQRQISQGATWEVFARDNYTCRYCGVTGIPMTYDHIKLWEDEGDDTVENGVCSCRKCNKTRGNMDYAEWLKSKYYRAREHNLSVDVRLANAELATRYLSFKPRVSKRSR